MKIFFITGTSKGIGKYLAEYYLKKGNKVIGTSRSKESIKNNNYEHIIADISNEKDILKIFSQIKQNYSKLDVLINNAGIASMNHSMLTPSETVSKIINLNVNSTFLCIREGVKLLRKSQSGRIINFTSVAAPLNLEGESIYAASKAAINSLTKTLSKEIADFGITINSIGPNPIETGLIKNISKKKINNLINSQSIKRYGTFEDISNVTDFFISPNSNFITGQIIYLGGIS